MPTFQVAITDSDGPVSLDGKTVRFDCKKRISDTTAFISKSTADGSITLTEETGVAEIPFLSPDTSGLSSITHRLVYDVELISGTQTYTVESGVLLVEPDLG